MMDHSVPNALSIQLSRTGHMHKKKEKKKKKLKY